jgi:hypothetical protein
MVPLTIMILRKMKVLDKQQYIQSRNKLFMGTFILELFTLTRIAIFVLVYFTDY